MEHYEIKKTHGKYFISIKEFNGNKVENCTECIFNRKCQVSGILAVKETDEVCSSFEDLEFFVEIYEDWKSGYSWVEMSHSRYTETSWDAEPTEWEIYEREANRLLEEDKMSDRKKKRVSVE